MAEVTMTLDTRELNKYLAMVQKNLGNIRPILVVAKATAAESAAVRFRAGGQSPFKWKQLRPSTKAMRAKKSPATWPGGKAPGVSQPILNEYGTLFQSVTALTGGRAGSYVRMTSKSLEFGTTLVKAKGLQLGMPARSGTANVPAYIRKDGVKVKAHSRQFRFGKVPARPFLYWSPKDIKRITSYAAAFAFDPENARRFA